MAEVINLRQARKAKLRDEKDAVALQNRVKFGRTKAEKTVTRANTDLEAVRLDGHRRDDKP